MWQDRFFFFFKQWAVYQKMSHYLVTSQNSLKMYQCWRGGKTTKHCKVGTFLSVFQVVSHDWFFSVSRTRRWSFSVHVTETTCPCSSDWTLVNQTYLHRQSLTLTVNLTHLQFPSVWDILRWLFTALCFKTLLPEEQKSSGHTCRSDHAAVALRASDVFARKLAFTTSKITQISRCG